MRYSEIFFCSLTPEKKYEDDVHFHLLKQPDSHSSVPLVLAPGLVCGGLKNHWHALTSLLQCGKEVADSLRNLHTDSFFMNITYSVLPLKLFPGSSSSSFVTTSALTGVRLEF